MLPRTPEPCTERYDGHCHVCPGRRPGTPKWVPGWCGGWGGVARCGGVQFLDKAADVPVVVPQLLFLVLRFPQDRFFLRVLDIPVATQRQVPTVQTFTRQVRSCSSLTRWSMFLLCRSLTCGSSSSWTRSLSCPLCVVV